MGTKAIIPGQPSVTSPGHWQLVSGEGGGENFVDKFEGLIDLSLIHI